MYSNHNGCCKKRSPAGCFFVVRRSSTTASSSSKSACIFCCQRYNTTRVPQQEYSYERASLRLSHFIDIIHQFAHCCEPQHHYYIIVRIDVKHQTVRRTEILLLQNHNKNIQQTHQRRDTDDARGSTERGYEPKPGISVLLVIRYTANAGRCALGQ